jgi:16S rRNA (adenine1518-N6/adenine1519-N6)-dimethyltransferase
LNLYDPGTLQAFLKKNGLRADKGLGQHFLVSESAVKKIESALDGCQGILEIGPGPGVLTGPISERAERFIALELDPRFVRMLAESAPRAEVRQADALQTDIAAVLQELPEPRAIVSNLPYYITAPLLQRVADARPLIDRAVLMMQKEVADRVAAPPGDGERGSLSVYLQALFSIRAVASVPAGAFLPPPKVDSKVLRFDTLPGEHPESLFKLVRMGFTQPRKTLVNNLAAGLHLERDPLIDIMENLGWREKIRAQDLSLDQWQALAAALPA